MLFLDECRDVRIEGLTFRDSGFWNLHLYRCRDVVIEGVTIKAPDSGPIRAPSSDGIDLDSSRDVVVRRTNISVGDDCIALKGTKGPHADQDADSPPVENIVIEDCTFGEGHGVLTCGSEAMLVRNVTVRRCKVTGANNVLSLKLRPDTPQRYEDILIEDVDLRVSDGGRLLKVQPWSQFFDLAGQAPSHSQVKNVTVRNVRGVAHRLRRQPSGDGGDHETPEKPLPEIFAHGGRAAREDGDVHHGAFLVFFSASQDCPCLSCPCSAG
jgi:alpha-L-rhamnosidase